VWAAAGLRRAARTHPLTLAVLLLLVGSTVLRALIERILPDGVQLAVAAVAVIVIVGFAERAMGRSRTAIALIATGAVGFGAGWLVLRVTESLGFDRVAEPGFDPLTALLGTMLAASAFAGPLWGRRVRVVGFAGLAIFALYGGTAGDVHRLIAAVAGLLLGFVLAAETPVKPLRSNKRGETRNLVAVIVAVSGLGPLVASFGQVGVGPLSTVGLLFGDPFPTSAEVLERCTAAATSAECTQLAVLESMGGPGALFMSVVPLLLLLIAAVGLQRGRRFAVVLAVIVHLSLAVLAFRYFDAVSELRDAVQQPAQPGTLIWLSGLLGPSLVSLGVILLLVRYRRFFAIRASRSRVKLVALIASLTLVVLILAVSALSITHLDSFLPALHARELWSETIQRFLPANAMLDDPQIWVSGDAITRIVGNAAGPAFWAILLGLFAWMCVPVKADGDGDDEMGRFRSLLTLGGSTISHMGTWAGNAHWFARDGLGAVAYRLIDDVVITLSDPVCAPRDRPAVLEEFLDFCDENGWTVAFYSVHDDTRLQLENLGWSSAPVGVETVMSLPGLAFEGKSWQKVRYPLNRGTKEGLTALWTRFVDLPDDLRAKVQHLSRSGSAAASLPEMGFTLGSTDEMMDPAVRLLVVVGTDGGVQALTSWLPVYENGSLIGWTLDVMKRGPEAMPGVMEFAIASAALRMRDDGCRILSLSGAPLAPNPDAPSGTERPLNAVDRSLEIIARVLEPAYGFRSLFAYKSKFHPSYHPLHLVYRDALTLPRIGRAVSRAYVPHMSIRSTAAVLRVLTRRTT